MISWKIKKSTEIEQPLIFTRMSNAVKAINPNADVVRRGLATSTVVTAALGLQSVVKSNLGPKGTLKMYLTRCFIL